MTQDSGIDLGNCLGNFELVNKEVPNPDSDVLFHLKILHVSPSLNSLSLRKFDDILSFLGCFLVYKGIQIELFFNNLKHFSAGLFF